VDDRDLLDELAGEVAARPDAASAPAATEDLESFATGPTGPGPGEESESDWEFNQEPSPEAPVGSDPAPDPSLDCETEAGPDLEADALQSESEPKPEPGEAIPSSEIGLEPSENPDPLADLGPSADPEPLAESEPEAAPAPPLEAEAPGPEASSLLDEASWAADAQEEGDSETTLDPDRWDFVPEEDTPPPALAPVGPVSPESEPAQAQPVWSAPNSGPPAVRSSIPKSRGLLAAVGWLATSSLVLFALVGVFWPRPHGIAAGTASVGGFAALDLRTRVVENAHAGPLLVVSGGLRHENAEVAPTSSGLRVVLVDGAGQPLPGFAARFAPPLDERVLREETPEAIEEQVALAAHDQASAGFAPDATLRVEAVFENPPREAVRFVLEPVSLPPGPAQVSAQESGVGADEGGSPESAGSEEGLASGAGAARVNLPPPTPPSSPE
jgi:hypothetical protein